ncbi:MAG: biopolymer transporter ExbD [candidate division WOR-3 bacterium]
MAVVEGAQRGGKRRRGRIINDLTPMVDIAFLLVIFFMTTTVFREPQAIEIALPPKGTVPTAQSNVITIFIDSLGNTTKQLADEPPVPIRLDSIEYYLRIEERKNVERQPGGQELLAQYDALPEGDRKDSLEKFIKRKVSKLVVLVDVHGKSLYQDMVRVMDQVQQAGIVRFSIIPHIVETPPPTRTKKGGRIR